MCDKSKQIPEEIDTLKANIVLLENSVKYWQKEADFWKKEAEKLTKYVKTMSN